MKKLVIGFSKPKSFWKPFAWLIRLYERTPFSHVYMKHFSDKYQAWLIYQASGAQVNFMSEKNFNHVAIKTSEFLFDISDDDFDSYMAWAIQNAGAPYSMKKILEIVLRKDIWPSSEPQWVCSVLAGFALKGKIKEDFDWQVATPKHIYQLCEKYGTRVS